MKPARGRRHLGFTLVELMITAAVSTIILAGFIMGVIALQRSFSATEFYASAQSDETRILDYVTRDVRRAKSIAISSSTTLNLTVPTYIVAGNIVAPTISKGSVVYSPSNTTVSYTLIGSQVLRTENSDPPLVIANHVSSFTAVLDPADSFGNTVITTVAFSPTFRSSVSALATAGTTISCKAVKRN